MSSPTYTKEQLDSLSFAQDLDQNDTLSKWRNEFHMPPFKPTQVPEGVNVDTYNTTNEIVYLCGNSLGLQPKSTQRVMMEELTKWQLCGVEGHFEGERPWARIDEKSVELAVPIVGAKGSHEVAIMNTLTNNLHLLLLSFYQPTDTRYKIIMENGAFCSDSHVIHSQLRFHNRNIETDLILVSPRDGEGNLRTEDILSTIEQHGDTTALILFPGIQFYSGQFFEIQKITQKGHEKGCVVGFDLAHAVGNVPLHLHDWDVDFAAWCNYKYCNSGPGAIAGAFVHEKFFNPSSTPTSDSKISPTIPFVIPTLPVPVTSKRLDGWWGQELKNRFGMALSHIPFEGAQAWQHSNPPVTTVVCVEASYQIFKDVGGVDVLRQRSLQLTAYLEQLINQHLINNNPINPGNTDNGTKISIITPTDPNQRGCQLSVEFSTPIAGELTNLLTKNGVIVDARKPRVIRYSPAPLYNSYTDIFRAVMITRRLLQEINV